MDTFEEIDTHIKGCQTKPKPVTAAPSGVPTLADVCAEYKVVKPIIVMLSKTPFLPASWKTAVNSFLSVCDKLCP